MRETIWEKSITNLRDYSLFSQGTGSKEEYGLHYTRSQFLKSSQEIGFLCEIWFLSVGNYFVHFFK